VINHLISELLLQLQFLWTRLNFIEKIIKVDNKVPIYVLNDVSMLCYVSQQLRIWRHCGLRS
jgi:hypothetical protein